MNHFHEAFELLMNYDIKFPYQGKLCIGTLAPEINLDNFNDILVGSRSVEIMVERAIKFLHFIKSEDQRNDLINKLMTAWRSNYLSLKSI